MSLDELEKAIAVQLKISGGQAKTYKTILKLIKTYRLMLFMLYFMFIVIIFQSLVIIILSN